jgi:hypothetical protein
VGYGGEILAGAETLTRWRAGDPYATEEGSLRALDGGDEIAISPDLLHVAAVAENDARLELVES